MEIFGTNFKQKTSKKYCCEVCDYSTERKHNLSVHYTTAKHTMEVNGTKNKQKTSKSVGTHFQCESCDKIYQTTSGLWKHNQKCHKNTIAHKTMEHNITPDLIIEIIKQNQELQKQNQELTNKLFEVCKNGTYNNNNNTNNSHNKTFNLQFFLNETCKDAMNIMDFVDSIKLQLTDLEKVGKIGYVEGISNIIVKNLNSLDETKRPVHCTDTKREVIYVKDENKWEKENENKKKLRKLIKHIAHKNSKMLNEFKKNHPDCDKSDSRFSDQYNNIVIEALGGKGDNDLEKEDKIIRNIAREVTIDKNIG